ncbi:MAG TPA: hypothetical protein VFA67_08080 [Candidatus Sulfotelmatobacter sp.]|nr:hypothetical protein [Candidatus Sulfotelmatobacter sp.]
MKPAFCMMFLLLLIWPTALLRSQEPSGPVKEHIAPSESVAPVISDESLPKGARLYVAPISNGFETYITAGIEKKKVPIVIVADRTKADYELTGVSDSDRAGWAKMLFLGSQQTNEAASIKIVNLKTGNVVFAYSVNKTNSVRGKQSAGEAVAKHINEKIENRFH